MLYNTNLENDDQTFINNKENAINYSIITLDKDGKVNAYCNKKQDKKKCVRYNGAQGNDKMVKPLLEELADYLQADNDEYQVEII